jgi:copper(I)-binding protein
MARKIGLNPGFGFTASLAIAFLASTVAGSAGPALARPLSQLGGPRDAVTLAADTTVSAHEAWARASAGSAANGAAYVTLKGGAEPDQLVGASTPVADMAEVHETTNDNGVMKMRPVPAMPVPAGKTVALAPGGYHIMLMGLKHPLVAGQSFPLTLAFARGGKVTLDVQVKGTGGQMGAHDNMQMK